jgi:hypothetical protein
MRRRFALTLIAGVIACSLQAAAATSLTTTSAGVGAGTAAVTACDGNGFTFRLAVNVAGRISNVTTSGIDASCAGGNLSVTLLNGASNVGSGSASLPSSGFTGSVDLAISPMPLSTGVTAVLAAVQGP